MKSTSLTLAAGLCLASFTTASLAQQAGSNPDANSQPNDREAAASAVDPTPHRTRSAADRHGDHPRHAETKESPPDKR